MPTAILDANGFIVSTIPKPSPFTVIPKDGRLAGYNPPAYDSALATLVAVEPVEPEDQEVQFQVWNKSQFEALPIARERKWSEIKAARDAAEFGGFEWDGSVFDSGPTSVQRIGLAIQHAAMAKAGGFSASIDWTLANNNTRTLDQDSMLAVGLAMTQHITAQHTRARMLRTQIEIASSVEEVNNITW